MLRTNEDSSVTGTPEPNLLKCVQSITHHGFPLIEHATCSSLDKMTSPINQVIQRVIATSLSTPPARYSHPLSSKRIPSVNFNSEIFYSGLLSRHCDFRRSQFFNWRSSKPYKLNGVHRIFMIYSWFQVIYLRH